MTAHMHSFTSAQSLVSTFADTLCAQLREAIEQRGSASLMVSGGSTPLPLFKTLSHAELDWSKVTISLVDERWVPGDHADANDRLVREHLLQNHAAKANYLSPYTGDETPEQGLSGAKERLSSMAQPFDVVILGMGGDGHTASLFPCCDQLEQGFTTDELLLATHPTKAPHARISLSLKAILAARHLYLHISGQGKKAVLDQALAGSDPYELPIRAVLQQAHVDVYWSEA
ncbi:6-phosphogluconolactonase [Ferrimonas gelatinilytica]|uniref:6-phosphogluconolactonase n=1 Tax=Ferrimonas gelatinilytica TaxID=1255257 RepID=A0ABP9RVZ2_9GAMM